MNIKLTLLSSRNVSINQPTKQQHKTKASRISNMQTNRVPINRLINIKLQFT